MEHAPLLPDAFAPAIRPEQAELPSRPARPYWQQMLRRLARDPRALFAGFTVMILVMGALLGPWLWSADPARQAPGQASQGPQGSRLARVVVDNPPWRPPTVVVTPAVHPGPLPAPTGLHAVANTEWVRLAWQSVPGARGYRVFRNDRPPRDRNDLGLPLDQLPATTVGFEDRLQLRPRPYFYSVVPDDGAGGTGQFATLAVTPAPAIDLLAAQLQGLVPAAATAADWAGKQVTLAAHPLGTDYLGRDLLARLIYGARTSLFIGIVAPLCFIAFGVLYGAVAGYLGGVLDDGLMRVADFVVALPFLLFMILFRVAFGIGSGESGIFPLVLALVLLSWPATARLVRGQVLQLREEPYVEAARLAGGSGPYIIGRHLLPNVLGVVLVSLTFAIPSAIFTEAFLSFIGMGVTPPTPSWGAMSRDGMRTLLTHPLELLLPSLCISLTVLAFNLLGDALRDALDVRLERRP